MRRIGAWNLSSISNSIACRCAQSAASTSRSMPRRHSAPAANDCNKRFNTHAGQNAYFLYNTQCTYRLANSEIANMLRFTFDGTVLTDRSDCQAEQADLTIELAAETCGGVPPAALEWLRGIVQRAVLIEFDRFITAGHLAARVAELGAVESLTSISNFAGMDV